MGKASEKGRAWLWFALMILALALALLAQRRFNPGAADFPPAALVHPMVAGLALGLAFFALGHFHRQWMSLRALLPAAALSAAANAALLLAAPQDRAAWNDGASIALLGLLLAALGQHAVDGVRQGACRVCAQRIQPGCMGEQGPTAPTSRAGCTRGMRRKTCISAWTPALLLCGMVALAAALDATLFLYAPSRRALGGFLYAALLWLLPLLKCAAGLGIVFVLLEKARVPAAARVLCIALAVLPFVLLATGWRGEPLFLGALANPGDTLTAAVLGALLGVAVRGWKGKPDALPLAERASAK